MDWSDSYADGDGPDGDGQGEDNLNRGWIPPDDRLWRHPSEMAQLGPTSSIPLEAPRSRTSRWRRPARPAFVVGVVGAATVAATLTIVLTVVDAPLGPDAAAPQAATDTSMVTGIPSVPAGPAVMKMVSALSPSLVGLEPAGSARAGSADITGVVMPGGNLVVTAASAVSGASTVEVVTSDGKRHVGQVVGSDARAGVAVIKVDGASFAPASFADEDVQPEELALTACVCGASRSTTGQSASAASSDSPRLDVAVGMVRQQGLGASSDDGSDLLDVIEAEMPLGPTAWGGVLVDGDGKVIGILDAEQTVGSETMGLFVPTHLALGVADELAQGVRVEHGWLGMVCSDEPDGDGVLVSSVMPKGPAAGAGLHPGDVVERVDSHQVVSLADLESRLYTEPPGTGVDLSVLRPGGEATVVVTLASTPTN